MNPSEQDIEKLLRGAPMPTPPAGLKQKLVNAMNLPSATAEQPAVVAQQPMSWWRRWWPALAPGAVSVACAVVVTVQQAEIRRLNQSIHTLSTATTTESVPPVIDDASVTSTSNLVDPRIAEQAEIARLAARVQQLTTEITQLEQAQKENEHLRAQLAAAPLLTQEELDALTAAKEKAQSISCVNNLKQIGLAVRLWAVDHQDNYPPNMLSMSNELNTPKILVCPADTNRSVAKNWESFTTLNLSYEYLTPSATNADHEPSRVATRCPIHGHIGLCDGSVQGSVARNHPEWLIDRDGKLYMERNAQPGPHTPNR